MVLKEEGSVFKIGQAQWLLYHYQAHLLCVGPQATNQTLVLLVGIPNSTLIAESRLRVFLLEDGVPHLQYFDDSSKKPLIRLLFNLHNRQVMSPQEKTMVQSIQRETFMLEKIALELVPLFA